MKRILISIIVFLSISALVYFLHQPVIAFIKEHEQQFKEISLVFTISGALGALTYRYLDKDIFKFITNPGGDLSEKLNELRKLVDEITAKNANKYDELEAEELIRQRIDNISEQELLNIIDEKYHKEIFEESKLYIIGEELSSIKFRIESNLSTVSRYGNINLSIGVFTTFLVIYFLYTSLVRVAIPTASSQEFLYTLIPRISLSILIEVFAFFFLRLYKQNLADIKYLTNERTNIEMKIVAVKTAMISEDEENIRLVVSELLKTERNFVLKKGESTVEIEKHKADNINSQNILQSIVKILDKK